MDNHIWFSTLIWLMVIRKAVLVDVVCRIRDGNKAVCSYSGKNPSAPLLYQFPGKHISKPEQMQSIDISGNQFRSANFNLFSNLKQLYARNVIFAASKSEEDFINGLEMLKKLEEIDLSGSVLYNNMRLELKWPPELVKLTLANMNLNEILCLEKLHKLEELDFSSNNLQTLPKLNGSCPIVTINLNINPIDNIAIEQVAPLCQLTAFFIEIKQPGSFNTEPKYHQCKMLDHWFTKYSIATGSFSCGRVPAGYHQQSNYEFSAEATKTRNDCLNALPSTSIFELLLYVVFFSLLFPVLYFANEAYNRYQSRKQASSHLPVKKHKKHRSRTAPLEVDVESNHSEIAPDPEQEENGSLNYMDHAS